MNNSGHPEKVQGRIVLQASSRTTTRSGHAPETPATVPLIVAYSHLFVFWYEHFGRSTSFDRLCLSLLGFGARAGDLFIEFLGGRQEAFARGRDKRPTCYVVHGFTLE